MNKKILTLDDLYTFYSTKKKSMNFNSEKSGYNLCVASKGTFEFDESKNSEGLLYGTVKAFHDLTNNNKSHIETDVFKDNLMSMKDRPIMADIIETEELDSEGKKIKDFNGHSMIINDEDENQPIIYIEKPVGHFINPEGFKVEYDEEYERNFAVADCVIYEEYTDTCDILRRRKQVDCSVELVIRDLSYNAKNKEMYINDFYVQGCTLLGAHVKPGMSGSHLALKDFSESNNSLFYSIPEEEKSKLIDTLERINDTLSNFNKTQEEKPVENYRKEDKEQVENTENIVENKTVVTQEENPTTDETTEEAHVIENNEVQTEETPEVIENEEKTTDEPMVEENHEVTEEEACKPKKKRCSVDKEAGTLTYELSHDDVRYALYELLEPYCESDNESYWISDVYDNHMVYEGFNGKIYDQKYSKNGDVVSFEGERTELFRELLTASEKAELESLRTNYSSIETELNEYKSKELHAAREAVFADETYAEFMENEEFKNLKENMDNFSVDELRTKCELAFAKVVRKSGKVNFSAEQKPTPAFFAFGKTEQKSGFLDGLLKK